MKARSIILLIATAILLALVAGCSSNDKQEAAATPPATDTSSQVAQTHDCDGGCGMTNVPMDKLTEIDGKFYCQGCAHKVKAAAGAEDTETTGGHGNG